MDVDPKAFVVCDAFMLRFYDEKCFIRNLVKINIMEKKPKKQLQL